MKITAMKSLCLSSPLFIFVGQFGGSIAEPKDVIAGNIVEFRKNYNQFARQVTLPAFVSIILWLSGV